MQTVTEYIAKHGTRIIDGPRLTTAGQFLRWWKPGGMTNIGMNRDGTLHNPNAYPEADVRLALETWVANHLQKLSDSAKKAAKTRQRRTEAKIHHVAQLLLADHDIGQRDCCYCCGRGFSDDESIIRGIGPECWQRVLTRLEQLKKDQGELI